MQTQENYKTKQVGSGLLKRFERVTDSYHCHNYHITSGDGFIEFADEMGILAIAKFNFETEKYDIETVQTLSMEKNRVEHVLKVAKAYCKINEDVWQEKKAVKL